jgi:hypothetical protein
MAITRLAESSRVGPGPGQKWPLWSAEPMPRQEQKSRIRVGNPSNVGNIRAPREHPSGRSNRSYTTSHRPPKDQGDNAPPTRCRPLNLALRQINRSAATRYHTSSECWTVHTRATASSAGSPTTAASSRSVSAWPRRSQTWITEFSNAQPLQRRCLTGVAVAGRGRCRRRVRWPVRRGCQGRRRCVDIRPGVRPTLRRARGRGRMRRSQVPRRCRTGP